MKKQFSILGGQLPVKDETRTEDDKKPIEPALAHSSQL